MFALFVKNLFLGPFTVARVSGRLNSNLTEGGEPSEQDCGQNDSDVPASPRRGGRWWPTALVLGGLFYTSIACQV